MDLQGKQAIVESLSGLSGEALSLLVADYRGLTVSEIEKLRTDARAKNVQVRVVRNTLARRAFKDTQFDCVSDSFVGPSLLMFALEEPGAAAKVVVDFVKNHDSFEVRALAMGGERFEAAQLKTIAKLPTRDEALSMLMSVMQAPVTKLAQGLQDSYARLARVTNQVAAQKEAA